MSTSPSSSASTGRMAGYLDRTTQTQEEAFFLKAQDGELFCVLHKSPSAPRGGVVLCPSILAEEHKIYGAQVLAGRAFAAAGFSALRLHYRGTGHSSGVGQDMTVDSMLEDVATAVAYLKEQGNAPSLVFCGGRWGGLVAGLAAQHHPGAALILWEPVLDGPGYFRDAFRASQFSALAGGASALTVTQAVERVRSDGVLDTLGYPVHRALYDSAAGRSLIQAATAGPRPVLLVQVSRHPDLKPEFNKLKDAVTASGGTVETALVAGEGAWNFVDSPMPSPEAIVKTSAAWLARIAPDRGA